MTTIKFGTDGWRALMSTDFTMENVELLAQAFADFAHEYLSRQKGSGTAPKVAIGYDFRDKSEIFAGRVADVLTANKIEVILSTAACPTQAVSYLVVTEKCDWGVAITASHNPPGYNGFKIKSDFGGSADKNVTDSVERLVGKNPVKTQADAALINKRDFNERYLVYLKSYLKLDVIKASRYRVLVDSMHGVGAKNIEHILAGGKVSVRTIRGDRDVTFGGVAPEPIAKYLLPSIELMKSGSFDIGVVTDGDADRVGSIRPGGEFVSPGIILSLILLHFVQDLKKTGSVVTTLSNTGLIYRIARKLGVKVHETPVGFKYICEIMRRENVLIGGEESGGIAFQGYLYERDGILSALLLMQMMAMRNQSFDEILKGVEKEYGKLYYVRNDLNYPNELKSKLFEFLTKNAPKSFQGLAVKEVKDPDGIKFVLEDDNWLLFRLSGTEPILRVYSEASSQRLAEALVNEGKELAYSLR